MSERENKAIILKPGREKAIQRWHPWVFSGAIQNVVGNPLSGDTVEIRTSKRKVIAVGAYSQISQIRCRIWNFNNNNKQTDIPSLILSRINDAYQTRQTFNLPSNAYRLIHAESDKIPGLIVDIFDKTTIMQILSYGVEVHRELIAETLLELPEITSVYERSDAEVRNLEGLPPRVGYAAGERGAGAIRIDENGIQYGVSLTGQKTGFYLDQRDNRSLVQKYANDKEVLDCFSFSGGFSLNAAIGGAKKITTVDTSEEALELFAQNIEANNFDKSKFEIINADVFEQLRLFRDQGREFDLIILDPPKFAPTRKQVQKASRAYKDINLLALKMLRPGGILFTFSCSGGVDSALFQKIVAGAALDAEADVKILHRMTQAPDHPVLLSFPEGEYLKGLVCIKE